MCDDCEAAAVSVCNGYNVCTGCGVEIDRVLDSRAVWHGGEGGNGPLLKRVGNCHNPRLPFSSLRTYIQQRRGASGVARKMAFGIMRQHRWTSGSTPHDERVKRELFSHITESCQALNLPKSVQRRSETLFASVNDVLRTRSDGRIGILAASILRSAKEEGIPRSMREVARVFSTTAANITKSVHLLHTTLFLMGKEGEGRGQQHGGAAAARALHISRAKDFIPRFCSELGFSADIASVASSVATRAEGKGVASGNEPPSVAGGAILLVVEILASPKRVRKKQKQAIAAAAGVSVVTIVKVRKQLHKFRSNLFVPSDGATLRALKKAAEEGVAAKKDAGQAGPAGPAGAFRRASARLL